MFNLTVWLTIIVIGYLTSCFFPKSTILLMTCYLVCKTLTLIGYLTDPIAVSLLVALNLIVTLFSIYPKKVNHDQLLDDDLHYD